MSAKQSLSGIRLLLALLIATGLGLVLSIQAAPPLVESNSAALPILSAPPPTPTIADLLHHSAPSTPWTQFVGASVNVVFGNLAWQELDLSVPGRGLGFALLRTYNSANTADGPLGMGWTHTYAMSLTVESASSIAVRMGDGRLDRYTLSGGQWQPPGLRARPRQGCKRKGPGGLRCNFQARLP